jgi:hypothetical protein
MSADQPQDAGSQSDRRGDLRIETQMWVRVIGRDNKPSLRTGNIAGNGFFFEVEHWSGRSGDIGVMEISSEDRAQTFTTMASLVCVIGADDTQWSTTEKGVSYEFLPSDEATRTDIARTVRHIAEQHPEQLGDAGLEDFSSGSVKETLLAGAAIGGGIIEAGAHVRLIVEAATLGSKREVAGVVGDITESLQAGGTIRFWVPVFVKEDMHSPEVESMAREASLEQPDPAESAEAAPGPESIIDVMWKELVPEVRSIIEEADSGSSPTGKSHLSGRLSQISMPSALWLLDQERLSGVLEFNREDEVIVLYLSEGSVIDAESPNLEREPREHLSALMAWDDGEFEFRVEEIDRPDRIGVPTQGLLLDLAVASDEEAR